MFSIAIRHEVERVLWAIGLLILVPGLQVQAQDTPADEGKKGARLILLDKLDRPITLDRGIDANTPLKDVLEFLQDRYEIKFGIDPAWKKLLKYPVEDQPTKLPRIRGVRLATVLDVLLMQVNGDFEIRNDVIVVVPNLQRKKKIERPSDRQKKVEEALRAKLRKRVDLEKGIESNTPFKDVMAHVASLYDLNIVIDTLAFRIETKTDLVDDRPVRLRKMSDVSLENILRTNLKQVGGSYEIRDNLILIVPPRKNEQS
jgi:hypothetical protein